MSTTSKSPRKVALGALAVGQDALPAYSHRCSPKVYTQPQLFACLVLKEFFGTDYRGITAMLAEMPTLCEALALPKVPHYTTLQKACRRLLRNAPVQRLLESTLLRARPRAKRRPRVKQAALDSSGFEAHSTSHYFIRRREKGGKRWQSTTYSRFPKLALLCDCANHLILAAMPMRGPGPDITHFEPMLCQAWPRAKIDTLLADAGYDAEWAHCVAREDLGIRTLIPAAIGRPTGKPPTGYYRRLMHSRLHLTGYGQRWQAETTVSMIKRRLGPAVNARGYWSQCRALMLKAIPNILVLWCPLRGFLQSRSGSFVSMMLDASGRRE